MKKSNRSTPKTFRRTQSAVYHLPLRSIVLFPSCLDMSVLVSRELLEGLVSLWQPLLLPNPDTSLLCMTRNPDHFGFFFSLSLSSITVLPGISSTSCYAVVCEEAAFPCLDPGSGQHVDLILGRDLLAPEVVLRAIRLRLSTRSFVLKPFWSICPHFCHEPLRRFTAGIFMGN